MQIKLAGLFICLLLVTVIAANLMVCLASAASYSDANAISVGSSIQNKSGLIGGQNALLVSDNVSKLNSTVTETGSQSSGNFNFYVTNAAAVIAIISITFFLRKRNAKTDHNGKEK